MAKQFRYIIIGGGVAGASAIEGIREHDRSGSIALIGKEDRLPYDRPPLSKGLWLGKTTAERISIRDEGFYRARGVHLFLGTEIVDIDTRKKQLTDRNRNHYTYERLLLATGGAPRALSFGQGVVHYFRTFDDYLTLRQAADHLDEFLVFGGGFIGAELAAALSLNKKNVTIVFPEQYLLQRILPADLAAYVTDYYRERGVSVVSGDVPVHVEHSGGKVKTSTKLGVSLSADFAIGAIGLNLHTEMAKRAGLKIENGIAVNSFLQSSDSNIFVAGDVAFFPCEALDKSMRLEHYNNAEEQGRQAGRNMAGVNEPYNYLPYFWSDLFDLGFEAVGDLDSRLKTYAVWKEPFREGVVYYLDDGKVKGILLWNVWDRVNAARDLITQKRTYTQTEKLKGKL